MAFERLDAVNVSETARFGKSYRVRMPTSSVCTLMSVYTPTTAT